MSRSAEKRGPERLIGTPPATKLSGSRLAAMSLRMSDCSLEMGTGRLLDLLGKAPRVHVALDPELARDGQHLLDRRIIELLDVPEGTRAELSERTTIEPD